MLRKRLSRACIGTVIIMIALILISCGGTGQQEEPAPQVEEGFVEYVGSTFVLHVPTRWKQTSSPEFEAHFLAPKEADFSANLGVSPQLVAEETTVQMVAEKAREFQTVDYPQYRVSSEQALTVGDRPAFKRTYTWHSEEFGIDIAQIQLFIKDGTTVYTLTATALSSNYDRYAPTFFKMLDSFQIAP
jgi:hypothetical protein